MQLLSELEAQAQERSSITWPGVHVKPGSAANGEKRTTDPLATPCSPSFPNTYIPGHCFC